MNTQKEKVLYSTLFTVLGILSVTFLVAAAIDYGFTLDRLFLIVAAACMLVALLLVRLDIVLPALLAVVISIYIIVFIGLITIGAMYACLAAALAVITFLSIFHGSKKGNTKLSYFAGSSYLAVIVTWLCMG